MDGIRRWLNPEDLETVTLRVPQGCTTWEAVEISEAGPRLVQIPPASDGSPVEFPVVHVWDDPSRSRALWRSKKGWRDEDPSELVKEWEKVRLQMFHQHLFAHVEEMQVVYLQPPVAEAVAFHQDGLFIEGWRIEMIAAFIGGIKPIGLEEYRDKVKIITDVGPRLRLV